MSFFRYIKHAFGLGDSEYDDEELEGIDARVTPLRERKELQLLPAEAGSTVQAATDCRNETVGESNYHDVEKIESGEAEKVIPQDIFDSVLKVFNEALPEFLQKTVDEKAQKDYLYERLEISTKDYLAKAAESARETLSARWENERRRLMQEMDELKQRASKEEEGVSEAKKQQLSAERQKRALGEKVNELEKQIANLEAENEQYVLENKSLINKIRLSQVLGEGQGTLDDAAAERLLELTAEVEQLQKKITEHEDARNEALAGMNEAQKLADARKVEVDEVNELLAKMMANEESNEAVVAELNEKIKAAENQAMKNAGAAEKMEAENARLQQKLEESAKVSESAMKELDAEKKELEVTRLKLYALIEEHNTLEIEHEATSAKLKESLEGLEVVAEMNRQLDELEKARQNNESYLKKQREDLAQSAEQLRQAELEKKEYEEIIRVKDDAIRHLEELVDSLRKTVEDNQYEHSQAESALQAEIARLKERKGQRKAAEPSEKTASPRIDGLIDGEIGDAQFEISIQETPSKSDAPVKKRRTKKNNVKISAIDDTLEDIDWLLATPPAGKNGSKEEKNEFGYKEPTRRQAPENPAQMSLW